ncbi:MAG: transcriptional repressor [Candidatus Pacebacteria bacterium]|nr:transcriptional repressor [Candidatus Paceibacterota bacterium]
MNLRLTKKRAQILSVLQKHHGMLSVKDIHARLPDVDLVTIYRNLDLFVKEKMIKEVHLGTEEAQYEYQTEPHHHAVCTECERVIHFTAPDDKLKKVLGLKNFVVDEIEVTVRGTCKSKNQS